MIQLRKSLNVLLIILCGRIPAIAQGANPYISMSINSSMALNGTSVLEVRAGNAGDNKIVANSLRIVISVGTNAKILGLGDGSDSRWNITSLSEGTSTTTSTIALTNKGNSSFGREDLAAIYIKIKGTVVLDQQIITGNISYIVGVNPLLNGFQSASQGNMSITDDNSTTTLSVVKTIVPSTSVAVPDLSVKANECDAILSWKTLKQNNIDSFEVVYSTNGKEFAKLESIPVKQNETGSTYEYVNYQGVGKAYYRLKIFEKNAKLSYSKIVSIETKCIVKKGF